MNKSEKHIVMAIAGLVLVVVLANQMGYVALFPKFQTGGTGTPGAEPIGDTAREQYLSGIGKFELSNSLSNSMSEATSLTIATDIDVIWWHFTGGQWIHENTIDPAATEYFDAKPEDNGYAWITMEASSSTDYFYIDYAKTRAASSYVVGYQYTDVDGDSKKEFVFQYNLKMQSIPSNGFPVLTFKGYAMAFDGTGSVSTTMSNLANQTGFPQTTNTTYYEEYLTISAEKKAIGIYKIEFKVTTTDETKIHLKSMMVPGYGKMDVSQFTVSTTSTEIKWTHTFSSNFDGALYLTRPVGDLGKLYFTTECEYLLTNSDDILHTWSIYYLLAPSENGGTLTDTLYAQEQV